MKSNGIVARDRQQKLNGILPVGEGGGGRTVWCSDWDTLPFVCAVID